MLQSPWGTPSRRCPVAPKWVAESWGSACRGRCATFRRVVTAERVKVLLILDDCWTKEEAQVCNFLDTRTASRLAGVFMSSIVAFATLIDSSCAG